MKKIIHSFVLLTLVAIFCGFALSHMNRLTLPKITKQTEDKQNDALKLVLPEFQISEKKETTLDGNTIYYWTAEKKIIVDEVETVQKAFAFIATGNGYAGPVKTIAGVLDSGEIIGISVIQQNETPGLGARCLEVSSKLTLWKKIGSLVSGTNSGEETTSPWFQEQFKGLNLNQKIEIVKQGDWQPEMKDELLKKNSITSITGATITSRTISRSLEKNFTAIKATIAPHMEVIENEQ